MEIIDLYLFNNKKELIDIISDGSLIDNTQEQHLNGLITHTVSGVYTDSIEDADYFGLHDVDDNGVFWRYRIDTKNKREGKFTLDGTYELFDDLKGKKIITDLRPYNYTAIRALTELLNGTGWQVGNVSTSKIGYSNWYYINTLSAFWDYLEKWGVEFKPRMVFSQGKVIGRYIDIADRISNDYGKWYEYGSDLLTVEAETDLTNIATAYYGRGKGEEVSSAEDNASGQAGYGRKINFADIVWSKANGNPVDKPLYQEYVELPELTELYGFDDGTPRFDIVEFNDIEDKAELLQATYDYAIENARPKVHFKSTVSEDGIAELGEVVTIIRDDLNIRYKTRIFKIKRSFFNNKIKDFEFGDELIISQAQSTKQAQKETQKQIDEASTFWLVALREAITDTFWNEDGYNYDLRSDNEYGLPGGYYSFDRPIDQNPTKAIYMGAGKLLIANSKDPNGEWIWETALDGDGVMAEKIVGYNSEFVQSSWNGVNNSIRIDTDGLRSTANNGDWTLYHAGAISFGNSVRPGVYLEFADSNRNGISILNRENISDEISFDLRSDTRNTLNFGRRTDTSGYDFRIDHYQGTRVSFQGRDVKRYTFNLNSDNQMGAISMVAHGDTGYLDGSSYSIGYETADGATKGSRFYFSSASDLVWLSKETYNDLQPLAVYDLQFRWGDSGRKSLKTVLNYLSQASGVDINNIPDVY